MPQRASGALQISGAHVRRDKLLLRICLGCFAQCLVKLPDGCDEAEALSSVEKPGVCSDPPPLVSCSNVRAARGAAGHPPTES
eukprot:7135947-Alexandrium_andersonii.AAC.1